MKRTNWICWLLFACVCLAEARYKMRRPHLPPLPPQQPSPMMFKKPWPIGHRISVGNAPHVSGNFLQKRIPHKPMNYRIRRPQQMFNVLPTVWKNQMPMRGPLNTRAVLPQRPPVKEFHSMNKMPEYSPEYSPEYRPETPILPPTHRGGVDDDKGPIHTIPAPNLTPMDRPFKTEISPEEAHQRLRTTVGNYKVNIHGSLIPNLDLVTIGTSLAPQKTITTPTPVRQYEVTETNDINRNEHQTVVPTFLPPEFDVNRIQTSIANPELQSNELFLNHRPAQNIGLIGSNIQLGQPNTPMQTNLHSSLHVGFPATAAQAPYLINQQIPDLHVGHPAPAGPPLSATQLYELLNSFPQKITEQYQTGQQPQLQQHILQQQLGQFFQPDGVPGFSQPQMQSFNYDEQDNKELRQQQQTALDQEYVAQRLNTDYNVEPESFVDSQEDSNLQRDEEATYLNDGNQQLENDIEYEEANDQQGQTTFFNKVANNGEVSTQFYTTLPSREAAEKLAALAAAGNVNSQLIGQLRKQQQQKGQNGESLPANHKNENYEMGQREREGDDDRYDSNYQQDGQYVRFDQQDREQQKEYDRRQQVQQYRQRQSNVRTDKRPLRIMVPDETDYSNADKYSNGEKESSQVEYEYENDEEDEEDPTNSQTSERTSHERSTSEFGSRLNSKTGK